MTTRALAGCFHGSAREEEKSLKVVTWNLNSIRAREERLLSWLSRQSPDVVCLQETKVTDEQFPYDAVKERGYHAAVHGQKTYNGVAILSREPIEDIRVGFGDGVDDPQARCICGMVQGIRFVSVYVPNGDKVESDKYVYKREWLDRLRAYLDKTRVPETPLLISGDFNIAPDAADAADPDAWRGSVLFNPDMTAVMSGAWTGASRTWSGSTIRSRGSIRGGTTGSSGFHATRGCASTTSWPRRSWRRGRCPPASTETNGKARSLRITRR